MHNILLKMTVLIFSVSLLHSQVECSEVSESRKTLTEAIENKDISQVKALIESNLVGINELSSWNKTPLMEAAAVCDLNTVYYLIGRGADVNYRKDSSSETALYEAVDAWKLDDYKTSKILLALIKAGANINPSPVRWHPTPFMKVCAKHAIQCVNIFLENGVDLETQDSDGKTALMYSLDSGKTYVMTTLIKKGVSLETRDFKGKTALIYAIEKRTPQLVALLIRDGAVAQATDYDGTSCFMYALASGSPEITGLFMHIENDHKAINYKNESALFFIAKTNDIVTASQLLKENLEINRKNIDGETPFLTAVKANNTHMALFLFDNGAEVAVKTYSNVSATNYAVDNRNATLLDFLIAHKAPLETRDRYGLTPLMSATVNQDATMIAILLAANVNTNTRTTNSISVTGFESKSYTIPYGASALDIAKLTGNEKIIQLLVPKN